MAISVPFPDREVLVGTAADEAVTELGLTMDALVEAVRRGEADRRRCTELDPPNLMGVITWGRTTRYLREHLMPQGWVPDDSENYSRTVRRDGRLAIVVASGDVATGDPRYTPKTKQPKGPLTQLAVSSNRQLALFGVAAGEPAVETQTFLLLVGHRPDGAVTSELSRPSEISLDGWITDWKPRIILEAMPPGSTGVRTTPKPPPSIGPVDVPVQRRNGS